MRSVLFPLLLVAAPAAAQMPEAPGMSGAPSAPDTPDVPHVKRLKLGSFPPRPKKPRELELGVQLLGYFGGSFLSDLSPDDERTRVDGNHAEVTYDGFSGAGGGGGVGFTGSWRGILGFEAGALYLADRGSGDVGGGKVEMSQWAIHVPLMMKLSAPLPVVRPGLLLGIDVVWPFEPDVTSDSDLEPEIDAAAGPYVQIAGGLELEFSLPISGMDFRIPLVLRVAWNPMVGNYFEDRAETDGSCTERQCNASEITLQSEWGLQVGATAGLAWYFH